MIYYIVRLVLVWFLVNMIGRIVHIFISLQISYQEMSVGHAVANFLAFENFELNILVDFLDVWRNPDICFFFFKYK